VLPTKTGADRVGAPWGLYQKLPYIKEDVREGLLGLAKTGLFEETDNGGANPEKNNEEIPEKEGGTQRTVNRLNDLSLEEKQVAMEERQTTMETRQIALENFLKYYVLEVDYVREDYDRNKNSRPTNSAE